MPHAEIIETAVLNAIAELNRQLPEETPLSPSLDTILHGSSAALDSLGLVTFFILVEEQLEAALGRPVALTDSDLFSNPDDNLRSVGAFVQYLAHSLDGNHGG